MVYLTHRPCVSSEFARTVSTGGLGLGFSEVRTELFFFLFINSRICEGMRLRVVGDLMVVSGLRIDGSTGTVFLEGFRPTLCYPSAVRRTWSIEYKV